MFILIAAFLVSSKYVANPKVRVVVFTSYFIACFFLIAWGWMFGGKLFTWFTLQQTVLVFINIRGIYRAVKDLKHPKKRDPFCIDFDYISTIDEMEDDNER